MEKKLAFVLSGGGAHGALQVGALRALFERGIRPDLMVGTSIGAVNSALLALFGLDLQGVDKLERTWHEKASADLMSSNYIWLGLRAVMGRPDGSSNQRMENLLVSHGLHAELRFGDIEGVQLATVAADLNSASMVVFGGHPEDRLLEGVLASAALPPWVNPIESHGRFLVDGGFVSNLPIQAAMNLGATEIIALDLSDPMAMRSDTRSRTQFYNNAILIVLERQRELELALAAARGVPVTDIILGYDAAFALWDFGRSPQYIERGYKIACRVLDQEYLPRG